MGNISRFDQFTKRDYNMEWYAPEVFTPNFEQWNSLLSSHQAKYDAAIAATQKLPQYLDSRVDLAGQYKQSTSASVDDITKTYMDQGLQAGNRKMRDFALKLNKDWQPGGLAYELDQEFKDYQGAQAEITKYYKDNKAETSVNKKFSLDQLQKAAKGEFKYDPKGDIYSRAKISADTRPYVDIMEEAQKVVKDIKENGTTDIIKMSPAWFEKIQKEEVTPETIKEVTATLLQQPKYAEQRQLELWGAKQNYTPAELTKLEEDTKAGYQSEYDKKLEAINKLKSTAAGKKDLQDQLQKAGYYDGKVNGSFDKASQEALDKYIADSKAKLEDTKSKTTADGILNEKMLNNYVAPLAAAYARQKVNKELIFNQEWGVNAKIAAGHKDTQSLISAVQKLTAPPTGDGLVTPGIARPMDTLDKIRNQYTETLDTSKKAFNVTAAASGINQLLGSSAPNVIHAATEARLKSATPEEFQKNLMNAGIVADPNKLWDYYNSPGAQNLQNSYLSMQQATQDLEGATQAQSDIITNYFGTSEGKAEMRTLKNQYSFLKNETDANVANMIINNDKRLSYETPSMVGSSGAATATVSSMNKVNIAKGILDKVNEAVKNNPNAFPESLRGYALNATKGVAADLEKAIGDDIETGYTNGYNGEDGAGIQFTKISSGGKGSKVDLENIDMKTKEVRFNIDAKGVTYYVTAKTKDGTPVQSIMTAPETHKDRLISVALDLKKQAVETNDPTKAALAEQMYSVLTKGPQINNAVNDALILTSNNVRPLNNVIEPVLSKQAGHIRTFGENSEIAGGVPVGGEVDANGMTYQKFKVLNKKTGASSYMVGIKTDKGFIPIENKNGGWYFATSQAADSPIIDPEMMSRIPVEINQQKIHETNVTEQQAAFLLQGVNKHD